MHVLLDHAHKPQHPIKLEELRYVPGEVFSFSLLDNLYDEDSLTFQKLDDFMDMLNRAQFLPEDFPEIHELSNNEVIFTNGCYIETVASVIFIQTVES